MALNWLYNVAYALLLEHSPASDRKLNSSFSDETNSDQDSEKFVAAGFQMPLHYPRYQKSDYEKMEDWKLNMLLREYGLHQFRGSLEEKRKFAMGAFLWPHQV